MPSNAVLKTMNFIHRGVLAVTRGRLGWVVARMPVVKLTTTGRYSGRKRQVILTSPYRNSQFILVVASRGGDDRHPDWYLNILADNMYLPTTARFEGGFFSGFSTISFN